MKDIFRKKWIPKLKLWAKLILNWRFLVCFGIGWMITNGWSYILLGIGTLTETAWMIAVAGGYLAFLWIPVSPEKVVTVAIALFLVRRLFPKHTQILEQQILEATGQNEPKRPKKRRKNKNTEAPAASDAVPDTSTEQSTAPTSEE